MLIRSSLGQYLGGYALGKLVGDTELPDDVDVRDVNGSGRTGWYEVWLRGVKIGTLRPGGKNGRFLRSAPNPPEATASAPAPVPVAAVPAPIPQIAIAPPQPAVAAPIIIPVVNTPSTVAPPAGSGVTTWLETPNSQPIVDPVTGAVTEAPASSMNKWIGGIALLTGGYFLAKALGFKSRL